MERNLTGLLKTLVLMQINCNEFCILSLIYGVLYTASRDGKPGMLCWCNEDQDPLPCTCSNHLTEYTQQCVQQCTLKCAQRCAQQCTQQRCADDALMLACASWHAHSNAVLMMHSYWHVQRCMFLENDGTDA
eukprot:1143305-Pelagomonas_calceolata.AAC.2